MKSTVGETREHLGSFYHVVYLVVGERGSGMDVYLSVLILDDSLNTETIGKIEWVRDAALLVLNSRPFDGSLPAASVG